MNKNKGFTLIELLTVIAILAVILLISTPIVLGALEKAKKNTFKNQALLYVDGLKQETLLSSVTGDGTIELPKEGKSISVNIDDIPMDSNTELSGNIVITNNNGNYSYILYITNGDYIICNKEYTKIKVEEIEKGNTCGDSLLYPTITNKCESQTYNLNYNITSTLILNGVTASDTRDGDITSKITYTGSVDTSRLGTYEITYRVENSLGNVGTAKRTIYVKDVEAPVITNTILKEEIEKGSTYSNYLNGITVEDNYDTGLEATYICKNGILQVVNCNTIGTKAGVYYVIYDAKDSSNNKYSETSGEEIKREIVVKDIDGPVITLKGNSTITVEVGSTFSEPGYTAIDDEDGDVTANVQTSSNLNTRVLGTYTIQYIVVDSSNNRGIATRTIKVVDTTKPKITNVGGIPTNWVPSATITVTASDNYKLHSSAYKCGNNNNWQSANTCTFNANGTYSIYVRDESENISDVYSVNIEKVDCTTPTVSLSGVLDRIKPKDSYQLPTSYTVNNNLSGGTVECKNGNTIVTNTSSLSEGTHTINCTVKTGAGKKTTTSKTIEVSYKIGDSITLKDNTTWYVIENSPSSSTTVTLFASQNIKNDGTGWTTVKDEYKIAFDEKNARTTANNSYCTKPEWGCNIYATNGSTVTEDSSIKKFLEGNVTTYINNSLTSNGGTNINSIRLITTQEICNIINASNNSNNCNSTTTGRLMSMYNNVPIWLYSTMYWTMTPYASHSCYVYRVNSSGFLDTNLVITDYDYGARPVIVTLKSNIQ